MGAAYEYRDALNKWALYDPDNPSRPEALQYVLKALTESRVAGVEAPWDHAAF